MNREAEVLNIINSITDWKDMPSSYLLGMRELLENKEWGVALEMLCENIHEFNISLPADAFDEVQRLCRLGSLNDSNWINLQSLVLKG